MDRALSLAYMKPASALLARKDTVRQESHLLDLIEAMQGFLSHEAAFNEAGLTEGCVEFSEDGSDTNLYGVLVNTLRPVPGKDWDQTRTAFGKVVGLRDLADNIARSGSGAFFTVEIDFATFRKDWIEPLQEALLRAGVDYDL